MAKRAGSRPGPAERKAKRPNDIPDGRAAARPDEPPLMPAPPAPAAEALSHFQRGMEALQRHAYHEAATAFQAVVMGFPGERALLDRARVYLELCERESNRRPPVPKTIEERLTAATAALNNAEDEAAEELASRALGKSGEPGFQRHFVTMVAHLARAKARLDGEDLDAEEEAAEQALALAWRGAGRLEIAAAQLALAECLRSRRADEEADELVREARELLHHCPDPGTLGAMVPTTAPAVEDAAAEELTEREQAVLRLLETDLSQREIGGALYVSVNTVKTHTRGIFRKLRASNRREAVERARALGLLVTPGGR